MPLNRYITFICLEAFLHKLLICVLNLNFSSIVIPKSFTPFSHFISVPCISMNLGTISLLVYFFKNINCNISGFSCIKLFEKHSNSKSLKIGRVLARIIPIKRWMHFKNIKSVRSIILWQKAWYSARDSIASFNTNIKITIIIIIEATPWEYIPNTYYPKSTGRVLPYLGMVWRLCGDHPRFWDFRSEWVPILCIITLRLTPLFLQKA